MKFWGYLIRKLGYALLTLFGVLSLVFFLFQVLPDPAQLTMGQRSDLQSLESARKEMGLDQSVSQQYLSYLNDLSPFSYYALQDSQIYQSAWVLNKSTSGAWVVKAPYLRKSYQSRKPVSQILGEAFEGTLVLALFSMLIAVVFGIGFGALAAFRYQKFTDKLLLFISTLGISLPSFFAAILIAWLFGFVWHRYTGLSMTGSLVDYSLSEGRHYVWANLLLPGIALGMRPLAIITQLTRSSMLEVMEQDYIVTAKAKGLSNWRIFRKHALRNALNPVVTSISGWFASLLAGAFFVEYIFNWKGIGKVTVDALEKADYPVVMGAVLLIASIFIVVNLVVDLFYKVLDPRVQLES